MTTEERFWSQVDAGDCWEWQGVRVNGYGRFSANGRTLSAHRFAYETLVGLIPDGLTLDHLCQNPPCVNPDHLEAVTNAENIRRSHGITAQNLRKTHCPKGHPYSGDNLQGKVGNRQCRECKRVYCRLAAQERTRRRNETITDEEREQLYALFDAGKSRAAIAEILGLPWLTVSSFILARKYANRPLARYAEPIPGLMPVSAGAIRGTTQQEPTE